MYPGLAGTFIAAGAPVEGDMPVDLVMNATTALAANRDTDNVTFFDIPAMTATTVAGGDFAEHVALSADGTRAVVTNLGDNTVQIWNMTTKALLFTVPITNTNGGAPYKTKITPDGTKAVVGVIEDAISSLFSVVDMATGVETLSFASVGQGAFPQWLDVVTFNFDNLFTDFDVDNTSVYLADNAGNSVRVYRLSDGVNTFTHSLAATGFVNPVGIDVSSTSTFAVVQYQGQAGLIKVDLPAGTTTTWSVAPLVLANLFVELTPSNSHAVVTTANTATGAANAEFINTTTGVRTAFANFPVWDPAFDGNVGVLPSGDTMLVDLTTLVSNGTVITPTVFSSGAAGARALVAANRRYEELELISLGGAGSLLSQTETGAPAEGDNPRRVAITPDGSKAVSANISSGNISVYNLGSNSVSANIDTGTGLAPSGTSPFDVAINPAGTRAVVPHTVSGETKIIDLTTNSVLATIATPFGAAVAINAAGDRAYVSTVEQTFGKVHVINLTTNTLVTTIDLLADNRFGITFPYFAFPRMTFTPDGSRLLVPIVISDEVVCINTATNTVAKRIAMGAGTRPLMAACSSNTKGYVTNSLLASVGVINPTDGSTTPILNLSGITQPIDVVINAAGTEALVNSYDFTNPSIYRINTTTDTVVGLVVGFFTPIRSMERNGTNLYAATVGDGVSLPDLNRVDLGTNMIAETGLVSGISAQVALSASVFGPGLPRAVVVNTLPDGVDTFGGPTVQVAPLTDVTLGLRGTKMSGGLAQLLTSDNLYHVTRSQFGFLANEPNVINVIYGFTSPNLAATLIGMTVEHRLNQPGGTTRWQFFQWNTNSYGAAVHTYAIGTTEIAQNLEGISATNRIRQTDGRIQMQKTTFTMSVFSPLGFDQLTDFVQATVQ